MTTTLFNLDPYPTVTYTAELPSGHRRNLIPGREVVAVEVTLGTAVSVSGWVGDTPTCREYLTVTATAVTYPLTPKGIRLMTAPRERVPVPPSVRDEPTPVWRAVVIPAVAEIQAGHPEWAGLRVEPGRTG